MKHCSKPKTLGVEFLALDDSVSFQDWKFTFKALFRSGLEIKINKLELKKYYDFIPGSPRCKGISQFPYL